MQNKRITSCQKVQNNQLCLAIFSQSWKVEVREGCHEVTRAGVEKQNPPKDQRETSRVLDGHRKSQIMAVKSEGWRHRKRGGGGYQEGDNAMFF